MQYFSKRTCMLVNYDFLHILNFRRDYWVNVHNLMFINKSLFFKTSIWELGSIVLTTEKNIILFLTYCSRSAFSVMTYPQFWSWKLRQLSARYTIFYLPIFHREDIPHYRFYVLVSGIEKVEIAAPSVHKSTLQNTFSPASTLVFWFQQMLNRIVRRCHTFY